MRSVRGIHGLALRGLGSWRGDHPDAKGRRIGRSILGCVLIRATVTVRRLGGANPNRGGPSWPDASADLARRGAASRPPPGRSPRAGPSTLDHDPPGGGDVEDHARPEEHPVSLGDLVTLAVGEQPADLARRRGDQEGREPGRPPRIDRVTFGAGRPPPPDRPDRCKAGARSRSDVSSSAPRRRAWSARPARTRRGARVIATLGPGPAEPRQEADQRRPRSA